MTEALAEFGALLAQARQGDQCALEQLTGKYEAKVRLVARVLLGPALRPYLDSMDLVQSVHRSLMLGLRQQKFNVSSPEQLVALALTMVRRKVARQWRHLQRQKREQSDPGDSANLPQLLAGLSSPDAEPARAAEINEAIHNLCNNLDEPERRLMEMRLQGYTTAEIADKLQIHPIALRVRLSRLRQRLHASGILSEWL
jgi:RNA polymerase sigma-70 factor (ECF subfamily)